MESQSESHATHEFACKIRKKKPYELYWLHGKHFTMLHDCASSCSFLFLFVYFYMEWKQARLGTLTTRRHAAPRAKRQSTQIHIRNNMKRPRGHYWAGCVPRQIKGHDCLLGKTLRKFHEKRRNERYLPSTYCSDPDATGSALGMSNQLLDMTI